MKKSYEDLQTSLGIARFYGDSIRFTDKKLTITKETIKQCKIRLFGIILVTTDHAKIKIHFNKKLVQWLSPNYLAQLFVISVISLFAFIFSFVKLNLQNIWACFFYAAINAVLISIFFRLMIRPFKESFFFLSSIYALLNLPLLAYLPLSPLFWSLFIGGYGFFLLIVLLSYKNLFLNKVFLGFIWILLSISTYSWFITVLKLSFDAKLGISLKQDVDFTMNEQTISWEETIWKKPFFWHWNTFSSWHSFFWGKEIIFQVQPIKPAVLLHTPDKKRFGWLSFSRMPAQEFLAFIPFYLENQKNLIWVKFLKNSPIVPIRISKDKQTPTAYTQSYLFFDFNTGKELILHFVVSSIETKKGPQSLIWCIKQDSLASMEYTLINVVKGISVRPH